MSDKRIALAVKNLTMLTSNLILDLALEGEIRNCEEVAATLEQLANLFRAATYIDSVNESAKNQLS